MGDAPFCAEASERLHEPLAGSAASDTDVWFVLEHEGPWAPKPLDSEGLPGEVRKRLAQWLETIPRSRLQLIRRPDRRGDGTVLLFGFSGGPDPWMVRFDLERPQGLLDLDPRGVLRDRGHPGARPVPDPLHLVCTHGKRDRCCAKWGMATYCALEALDPEAVWQTSHTGGHRFAANVLSFPHGISYGRVAPEEAGALLEAHRAGRLHSLDRMRGRTCHDAPTQAAEVRIRGELGQMGLDAVAHRSTDPQGPDRWSVHFEVGGQEHAVQVCRTESSERRPKSCGDEAVPVERYERCAP